MRLRSYNVSLWALAALSVIAMATVARASADFALEGAKLSISTIDGSSRISQSFSIDGASKRKVETLQVESDEVIRVAFTLTSADGEKLSSERIPHQVVVRLADADDASVAQTSIVQIKRSSGKATWSQRVDRLPNELVRATKKGTLDVALLIGSFGQKTPLQIPLITIQLPAATLATASVVETSARHRREVEQGFHRHADHHHTFGIPAADQMPPRLLSLVSAVATLVVPWVVLIALWSRILPSINIREPASVVSPFVGSIVALELLALVYWLGMGVTLFRLIPWLTVFGLVSVLTGRRALGALEKIRLGKVA